MAKELTCLEQGDMCGGRVDYRDALSGTGTPFPRCKVHWERRLALRDRLRRRYPDSSTPPDWFDPAVAGESWDDDH